MNLSRRILSIIAAGAIGALPAVAFAQDDGGHKGWFDSVLETLDVKAKPADPAPEFVRRTRPDASGLEYMQSSIPHKVSPIPTKSAAEVQAMKDALDHAHAQQLDPVVPPTQIVGAKKAPPVKPPN